MSAVMMSNPGLPLAVYGNPRRRGKHRRNPTFSYHARRAGRFTKSLGISAPNRRALKRKLALTMPGWSISSIKMLGASRRRHKGTTMTKTSHRSRAFSRRRARYTVGRTYRKRGKGYVRITRAHIRRHAKRPLRHPAVWWSGKKGKIMYFGTGTRRGRKGFRRIRFTNPRRRHHRRHYRSNPGTTIKAYVGGLTSAPSRIMSNLKGRGAIKHAVAMAAGGAATYIAGGIITRTVVSPLLNKIGLSTVMANPTAQRVVGAAMPYTMAFALSKLGMFRKYAAALNLGGALASIVELIMPGWIGNQLMMVPGIASLPGFQTMSGLGGLHGGVNGLAGYFGVDVLAGYVQAPSYAGVGGYVQAPSYAGVGSPEALAGYVQAPSYAGVGQAEALAGSAGIGSYLDHGDYTKSYLDW